MFGQGSFNVTANPNPGSAGPPFPLTAADNGLSVDAISGRVVLGQNVGAVGDPGQLLSAREVPLKGFSFTLGEAGSSFFVANPNPALGLFQLGDIDSVTNGTFFQIVDVIQTVTIQSGGFAGFNFIGSPGSQQVTIGDFFGVANGTNIDIQDAAQIISFNGTVNTLVFDIVNRRYRLGQLTGGNTTRIDIEDIPQRISAFAVNGFRVVGDTTLIHSGTVLANAAGAAAGTLLNSPSAGNPTKWIQIDDNGTIRKIPTWL